VEQGADKLESIVALITPFNMDGSLDEASLRELMRWNLECGTDGLVLCGTTGESPTLSRVEWERILQIGVEELGGKMRLIAGTGSYCTRVSVEQTLRAKELGMDGAMVIVPYYNKPCERGVGEHFKQVMSVGLPVIGYHNPGRTGVRLSHEFWRSLGIPVKDVDEMIPGCFVYCGSDPLALQMLQEGAIGTISVIGNLFPREWGEFVRATSKDSFSAFKALLEALDLEVNPKTIKCALALQGRCCDVLRLPLVSATEQTKSSLEGLVSGFSQPVKV